MSEKITNTKSLPRVYFGLHMLPGVAEYREAKQEPYRIFVNEATIRTMNASFQGRPVYVRHVDEVDLEKLHLEADGYVVRSFYNAADGKHWAEFIVVSDAGHEAIKKGWRLSNCYVPKEFSNGGLWNGVDYQKEVTRGEYDHLAIVPNPRYDESIILTPEQFKDYNQRKELELKRLTNSKGDPGMFKWFKREKIENAADIESMVVELPKSKREVTIATLVNEADAIANMAGYANGEHMVKVGEEEMSVNDLSKKFSAMCEEKKANEEKAEAEKKANEGKDEKKDEEKKENEDKKDEKEEKKSNAKDATPKDTKHFDALKNAKDAAAASAQPVVLETQQAQVARGQSRYGSGR